MKIFVFIALIIGTLSQSLTKILLVSNYILNKQEITIRYCENKSKPAMNCQGMCHLKKKLAEEEESKSNRSRVPLTESNELIWIHEYNVESIVFSITQFQTYYLPYQQMPLSGFQGKIFHPPTSIS